MKPYLVMVTLRGELVGVGRDKFNVSHDKTKIRNIRDGDPKLRHTGTW
jgi:hypothetical protein